MPKQVAEKHLTLVSLAGAATSRVPRPASLPANSLVATVLRQLPARQVLSSEATPRRRGCAPPPVLAETMLRQLAASPRARSARAQAILARTAETGTATERNNHRRGLARTTIVVTALSAAVMTAAARMLDGWPTF